MAARKNTGNKAQPKRRTLNAAGQKPKPGGGQEPKDTSDRDVGQFSSEGQPARIKK